ncbi:hypothetical protein ACO1O0_006604 [Amphichorda felina]
MSASLPILELELDDNELSFTDDEDFGPRTKVPRTTAPTQAGTPSGHNKTGKSPPKRNTEENISPGKVKTPRRATSASTTKQTAAAKKKAIPITKAPARSMLAMKMKPSGSSSSQTKGASKNSTSNTSKRSSKNKSTSKGGAGFKPKPTAKSNDNAKSITVKVTPSKQQGRKQQASKSSKASGKGKYTAKAKAATKTKEVNDDQSHDSDSSNTGTREKPPPSNGWKRTPSYSPPNDDNEETRIAKVNSRWHEPQVSKPLTQRADTDLHILVCGKGWHGELGLVFNGETKDHPIKVAKRPRLNRMLCGHGRRVVDIACGAKHSIALTRDGRILTWGCNEGGALGRDTEPDAECSAYYNLHEPDGPGWEPEEVDTSHLGHGIIWTQVVATDSASFALTDDRRVFGWGTFIKIGFSPGVPIQLRPKEIGGLKGITNLAAGAQHVLAIDYKCNMYSWGYGNEGQLGRLIPVGTSSLRPGPVTGLPVRGAKAQHVACGVENIVAVAAGKHHSIAVDEDGIAYSFGRSDEWQTGKGPRSCTGIPETVYSTDMNRAFIQFADGGRAYSIFAGVQRTSDLASDNGENVL